MATYEGDQWTWRDAEGYRLTAPTRMIRTPGLTREGITADQPEPEEET